jgi:NTP pyrophosphatase (non-canonical NTP hydrolase)
MDSIEYLEASARTASGQFHPHLVGNTLLEQVLEQAIIAGERADAVKKTLFYGKKLAIDSIEENPHTNISTDQINPDILHAALGLYTEATELLENILKTLQNKQSFDDINAFEECGDLEWYLAMLYRSLNRSPREAKTANIAKLKARYPDKFTSHHAIDRNIENERQILENHAQR